MGFSLLFFPLPLGVAIEEALGWKDYLSFLSDFIVNSKILFLVFHKTRGKTPGKAFKCRIHLVQWKKKIRKSLSKRKKKKKSKGNELKLLNLIA